MSMDSLKRNNKKVMKTILSRNSHTVILKRWRRVNIKIQNPTMTRFHNVKVIGLDQEIIEILIISIHPSVFILRATIYIHGI